jgi:two-component system sensor histidine kinase SenX3
LGVSVGAVALWVIVAGLVGLALGWAISAALRPRRRDLSPHRIGSEAAMTVFDVLERAVATAPIGVVVVGTSRDIVISNQRAIELGLVRERVLDDRVWTAAQRTLVTDADVDIDLLAPAAFPPAVKGCRCTAMFDC